VAKRKKPADEEKAMAIRLRRLRLRAGFSQSQLAKAADVSLPALLQWEHGRRRMTLVSATKLADALDISLDELAGRKRKGGA
jgi:transcriptional regulator with XRE-family HTH domain